MYIYSPQNSQHRAATRNVPIPDASTPLRRHHNAQIESYFLLLLLSVFRELNQISSASSKQRIFVASNGADIPTLIGEYTVHSYNQIIALFFILAPYIFLLWPISHTAFVYSDNTFVMRILDLGISYRVLCLSSQIMTFQNDQNSTSRLEVSSNAPNAAGENSLPTIHSKIDILSGEIMVRILQTTFPGQPVQLSPQSPIDPSHFHISST